MTHGANISKNAIIFIIVVPIAVLVGAVMANPLEIESLAVIGLVVSVLSIPIILQWHHPMLIFSWNAAFVVFFLPGAPSIWMPLSCISLFVSVLTTIMNRQYKLANYPSLTWPLLAMAVVVVGTAMLTGGLGLRSIGGQMYGGKKYFTILFAIIGFFALSCRKVPLHQAKLLVGVYILSGLTLGLGNLAFLAGENMYWLFYLFPTDHVVNQAVEEYSSMASSVKFSRLSGMTWAGLAAVSYLLSRYGLRGVMDLSRPWATAICVGSVTVSLFGGFRSIVVIYALLFAAQFYFEGLVRTRFLLFGIIASVLGLVVLLAVASSLPMSVQRTLSILPIPVNPAARADAQASTDWRLRMWQLVIPEIPRHLLLGKGYMASATDHYLAYQSFLRGLYEDVEPSVIAGDYHNGPLSIIIPFGVWGVLAFGAFAVAAYKVLLANYRHGPKELRLINTYLLSDFTARMFFFLVIFGAISSDLWLFAGLTGLSLCINGGIAKPASQEQAAPAAPAQLKA